jgi:hypothetical protein
MTLWQDPPPQTRRQARESERAAALQAENAGRSRRAGTAAPTTAGEIPDVNMPYGSRGSERGSIAASADEQTDARRQPPAARPVPPRYDGVKFDTLVKPARTTPELYQPAPTDDRPEPVTQPVSVVTPPPATHVPRPAAQQPTDEQASADTDRTLTRRELRAMLQAQQAEQSTPAQTTSAEEEAEPAAAESTTALQPEANVPAAWEATPAPVSAQSFADILSPPDAEAESPASAPRPYQPPTGHWSIAAAEPDDADPGNAQQPAESPDPAYARSRVSTGTVTSSNALILPSVPSIADATGPLTSTGEILVTGSIDLPRSLGATGTHSDRFDSSDIDRLFEQSEGEQNTADVAPIRASRAVSTHTSTRDTITPRKHPSNKLPTVLAITAAVLAVGVIGLLVAAYVFKVF